MRTNGQHRACCRQPHRLINAPVAGSPEESMQRVGFSAASDLGHVWLLNCPPISSCPYAGGGSGVRTESDPEPKHQHSIFALVCLILTLRSTSPLRLSVSVAVVPFRDDVHGGRGRGALGRQPHVVRTLNDLEIDSFIVSDYNPAPTIKAPVAV